MRAATRKAYWYIKRNLPVPTDVLIKRARRVFKQRKRRELGKTMADARTELNNALATVDILGLDKIDADPIIAGALEDCSDEAIDLYVRGGINFVPSPKHDNRKARRAAAARSRGLVARTADAKAKAEAAADAEWDEQFAKYDEELTDE